jgi:peptide-methionine (S)-S-oxide reductase
MTEGREVATLGGGCFWCLEAVFDELEGVVEVESGYMGGHTSNPTYEEVCSGTTGHAEVTRVTFDPTRLSYTDLLRVFFSIHDPTTLNRQGGDVGTQYRSVIFHHSPEQEAAARALLREMQDEDLWDAPVVTELTPSSDFHAAEDYHRDYFARNSRQPYCQAVIAPKVAKFRKEHLQRLRRA